MHNSCTFVLIVKTCEGSEEEDQLISNMAAVHRAYCCSFKAVVLKVGSTNGASGGVPIPNVPVRYRENLLEIHKRKG